MTPTTFYFLMKQKPDVKMKIATVIGYSVNHIQATTHALSTTTATATTTATT